MSDGPQQMPPCELASAIVKNIARLATLTSIDSADCRSEYRKRDPAGPLRAEGSLSGGRKQGFGAVVPTSWYRRFQDKPLRAAWQPRGFGGAPSI
jgi:hypothetical protein